MDISFLIVTRNRPADLRLTLDKLRELIDLTKHEVLVFIDGCNETTPLIAEYDWVQWSKVNQSISASPARNALYIKGTGAIFIGLDDDAHPISLDFINEVEVRFRESENLGIIAFQEVRGIFTNDQEALLNAKEGVSYETNDFVGCGFAVLKEAYQATNGFPVWMDIYGEESALALEVIDAGYNIIYDYGLKVNHRVDVEKRKKIGRNYFRFEHQLRNVVRYYLVYYRNPTKKIVKTLIHNFKKYALSDLRYFKSYWVVVFRTLFQIRSILKYRKPVKRNTIKRKNELMGIKY